jgi:hypothetical protein
MINKFSILLTAMLLHSFLSFSDYSILGGLLYHRSESRVIRSIGSIEKINEFKKFKNHLIDDCYFVFYIENFMTREKYYSIISPILEEAKKKFTSLDIFLKSTNQDLRQDYYESLIDLVACHFKLMLDNKNNIKLEDFNKAKNKMSQAIKSINVSTKNKINISSEMKVIMDLIHKANKELYKNITIFTRISSLFI